MKNIINKFFSDLLSIDEAKKSIVVLVFISFSIVIGFKFLLNGLDIPSNAMTFLITLSCLIFGINSINGISNLISSSRPNNQNYITPTNINVVDMSGGDSSNNINPV